MVLNLPLKAQKAQTVTLTITGEGDENYGFVRINGVKYWTPQTIEADVGTEAYFYAGDTFGGGGLIYYSGNEYLTDFSLALVKNLQIEIGQQKTFYTITIVEEATA